MPHLKISLNYITNVQPSLFNKTINNMPLIKQKKLNCKNFFFFLYLIKHFNQNKNNTIAVFIKPKTNSLQTILRAPYRHKLTKHQLSFSRYYIVVSFIFKLKNFFTFLKLNVFNETVRSLNKIYKSVETNICNLHKINISISYTWKNFFSLTKYNYI